MNVPRIKGRRDEKRLDDANEAARLVEKVDFWFGIAAQRLSHSITQIGRTCDKARGTQNIRRFIAEIRQMSPLAIVSRNKY
jgi:hypothetical protein